VALEGAGVIHELIKGGFFDREASCGFAVTLHKELIKDELGAVLCGDGTALFVIGHRL